MAHQSKFERHHQLPAFACQNENASVLIGHHPRVSGFCPALLTAKWGGRGWLQLLASGVEHDVYEPTIGDHLQGQMVRTHPDGRKTGEIHRWTPGDTEWDIEWASLADVPVDGKVEFELAVPEGAEIDFQPPLPSEQIERGANRPDNVVGSYAIYAPPHLRHNEFQTGKIGHIYRPELIDAKGQRCWASQRIADGKLAITLPMDWIRFSAFPLILDPTLGNSHTGATQWDNNDGYYEQGEVITGVAGTVQSLAVYYGNPTHDTEATFGLYGHTTDNGSTPESCVANTAGVAISQGSWSTANLKTPYVMTAGGKFHIVSAVNHVGATGAEIYADSLAGAWWGSVSNSWGYSSGSMHTPLTFSGYTGYRSSMYLNYTVPVTNAANSMGGCSDSTGPVYHC